MEGRFEELDIIYKNQAQYKTTCPNCPKVGKKKIKDTCLSVNTIDMTFYCHKCTWKGSLAKRELSYTPPDKNRIQPVSDKAVEWLINRGHTLEIIKKYKVVLSKDGHRVIFPYFLNNNLVNWKEREMGTKGFRQSKDGLQLMYNHDACVGQKTIIITESEEDCMMVDQAGFPNVCSVSQGAPNPDDKNISRKLECFNNSWELFEEVEKIIICVDNDPNGERLALEIKRRYGAEICCEVKFPDEIIKHEEDGTPVRAKDSRDVRLHFGIDRLASMIKNAKPVKIEGVFDITDSEDSLFNQLRNGLHKGTTTYFPNIDKHWKWRTGDYTVWTGYNNEGKSTLLLQLSVVKAIMDGWGIAFFSPESLPMSDFFKDVVEMIAGKMMDKDYSDCMTELELKEAIEKIKGRIFLIEPPENYTVENILDKAKYLVRTQGIKALVLDPYNTVEHLLNNGEREDLYISRFSHMLKSFAVRHDISMNLVAHQTTPQKDKSTGNYPMPDKYKVKGGGTFPDRADNLIVVWRPNMGTDYTNPEVKFISAKIRKQKLVGVPGEADLMYVFRKSRYYDNGFNPFEGPIPLDYTPDKHIEPSVKFDEIKEPFMGDDDGSDILPF